MRERYQLIQFFLIVFLELVFLPFLYFFEWFKNKISSNKPLNVKRIREGVISEEIHINIHEWGGYSDVRKKRIKNTDEFTCGLKAQLERFKYGTENVQKKLYLTVSDIGLLKNRKQIENDVDVLESVSNYGMDFSGYAKFYEMIKDKPNAYVLLSNTSINAIQVNFLDDYRDYMEKNPDVGMMGISYCSKTMQTLLRNNFNPHLQSFFLLTTIDVLNQIVFENNNKFPGKGIIYKRLLVKKGEIAMSKLTQKLGYNLAVSLENGSVFKFGKNNFFDNGFNRWELNYTDVRLSCKNPNAINIIKKNNV